MASKVLSLLACLVGLAVLARCGQLPEDATAESEADLSTLTIAVDADADVRAADPDRNFGMLATFSADASPLKQSFLKFDVQGIGARAVTRAVFKCFVTNPTDDGPEVYGVQNQWGEQTVTWNNRLAPTTGKLFDLGPARRGTWASFDVSRYVTGDGQVR